MSQNENPDAEPGAPLVLAAYIRMKYIPNNENI